MSRARRARRRARRTGRCTSFLIMVTLITVYPILWVFTIAFSGKQSLAIADLPADPTFLDRLRAVIPWPEHVLAARTSRRSSRDQPFAPLAPQQRDRRRRHDGPRRLPRLHRGLRLLPLPLPGRRSRA